MKIQKALEKAKRERELHGKVLPVKADNSESNLDYLEKSKWPQQIFKETEKSSSEATAAVHNTGGVRETVGQVFSVNSTERPVWRSGYGTKENWQPPKYDVSKTVSIDLETAIRNHCVALSPDFSEIEYYKVLRTHLRQMGQRKKWKTAMVTSVSPGEGKTVTAINLAATFAREFHQTVLLVDADLRRQAIHRYVGYDSDKGVLDYLEKRVPLRDIIVWPGIEKFTIISGGGTIADSAEMMSSPRMRELVEDLKNRYDDRHIIFDVPAVLSAADALAFAPLVDCIILVVGAGRARKQDLEQALEMLPADKIAGFVLNRFDGAGAFYGNSHGKTRDRQSRERQPKASARLKDLFLGLDPRKWRKQPRKRDASR